MEQPSRQRHGLLITKTVEGEARARRNVRIHACVRARPSLQGTPTMRRNSALSEERQTRVARRTNCLARLWRADKRRWRLRGFRLETSWKDDDAIGESRVQRAITKIVEASALLFDGGFRWRETLRALRLRLARRVRELEVRGHDDADVSSTERGSRRRGLHRSVRRGRGLGRFATAARSGLRRERRRDDARTDVRLRRRRRLDLSEGSGLRAFSQHE
jgi:hypothetical protein